MPKSVLATLTGLGGDRAVMETAIAAARIEGGHVTGQHARVDTIGAAAIVEATFPQARHDPTLLRHLGREDAERTARARRAFDSAARQYEVPLCSVPGEAPVSLGWVETRAI